MSNKKIILICSLTILLIILLSFIYNNYQTNIINNNLIVENNELKKELSDIKYKKDGILNMIPQYIDETNMIIDELSLELPTLKYNNENEKMQLEIAKQWLKDNKNNPQVLLPDEIVIRLGPANKINDNNYIIELLVYKKQNRNVIHEGEWPYPLTVGNIGCMFMTISKGNATWKVVDFKRKV